MKAKYRILLELNEEELEILKKKYTICVSKVIASELSLDELNQLIEKLCLNNWWVTLKSINIYKEQYICKSKFN